MGLVLGRPGGPRFSQVIRVQQIRLSVNHSEADLRRAVATALGLPGKDIFSVRIHRQGVDARHPRRLTFVYSVDVEVRDEEAALAKPRPNVARAADVPYTVVAEKRSWPQRPVIVGTGPAGLFAGWLLARAGARPLFLERGQPIEKREQDVKTLETTGRLNPESNIQFGEGGAGTFSDGKLNTSISDPRCRWVLEQLVEFGAPEEILIKAKPHVGTDRVRETVKKMRRALLDHGAEFRFGTKVTGLVVKDGRLTGLEVNGGETLDASSAVLAVGNAARDTFEMLHRAGVRLEAKPFSIGARIEHTRAMMDRCLYGPHAGNPRLGAADYKMAHHGRDGYSAYTFCMCPGGAVVPGASEVGGVVTNGMSEFARDMTNSNSALMVGVAAKDFGFEGPLAGMLFQRKWEERAYAVAGGGYRAPVQRVEDFLARRPSKKWGQVVPSYLPGATPANLWDTLPEFICEGIREGLAEFQRRIRDFAHPDALLTGVETRSSSPVRIPRDETFQTNVRGLYPAGEGAGHAGGIMSSAVDGLRAAEALVVTVGSEAQ